MNFKIKKDDLVIVIAGKEKGARGKIIKVIKETGKVLIAGVNMVKCFNVKKHKDIKQKEMPIHISNVAHIDPETSKPTKVKVVFEDGYKYLVSKISGAKIRKISKIKSVSEVKHG